MKALFKNRYLALAPLIIVLSGVIAYFPWEDRKIDLSTTLEFKKVDEKSLSPEIKQFGLIVSKLNLVLPVIKDVDGQNEEEYQDKLLGGVAHDKSTSLPGGNSNIFIFGHSSSNIGSGKYAKAFAKLNQLENTDTITVFYEDKKYEYIVKEKKVIEAGETQYLMPTDEEQLTLMTCWPLGTAEKRLVVIAEIKQ